jgi:phosphatidylglycerophosphate synthase
MDAFLDAVKATVRKPIRLFARALNRLTNGKLHPNAVTFFGLAMHLPIAFCIATNRLVPAALLLIIFGLFDALDGELARLQQRGNAGGMLLDSVTDRMKEILLYASIAYFLIEYSSPWFAVWAVLALGGSMLTSYLNAMGDVAMQKAGVSQHKINEGFRGGLLRFEVRMFLLVVALLTAQLAVFVVVVALLSWLTALQRLIKIMKGLQHVPR